MALMWLLRTRGVANLLGVFNGIALSVSYAGPLLEHLAKRAGYEWLGAATNVVKWLAKNRFTLFAGTWILFFVTTVITFVIAHLDDDAMQKWVKRSSFRGQAQLNQETAPAEASLRESRAGGNAVLKVKSKLELQPLFEKPEEELTELFNSFVGVTS